MRKQSKNVFIIFLVFILTYCTFLNTHAENTQTNQVQGMNVMFALDASTSMKTSDPENLRIEALKLFVDMCFTSGDSLGMLSYGNGISSEYIVKDIKSNEDKEKIKQAASTISLTNATDIGMGIKKAVDNLNSNNNQKKSLVIFLSDGKNDPLRSKAESEKDIDDALNTAKNKGFSIYTIGLNADGAVDSTLLQKMAKETGGKSFITSKAQELPEILEEIFLDYSKLKKVSLGNFELDKDVKKINLSIPNSNVVEANIVCTSNKATDIKLFNENNQEIKNNILKQTSSNYSLIKVLKPAQGNYYITINGSSKDNVNVSCILNYQLSLENTLSKTNGIKKGDTIGINSVLKSNGEILNDKEQYKNIEGKILIGSSNLENIKSYNMNNTGDKFTGEIKIEDSGEFKIKTVAQGTGFYRESDWTPIKVFDKNIEILKKFDNISIDEKQEKVINLFNYFKDSGYLIYSFDAPKDLIKYTVEGNQLKIDGIKKGYGKAVLTVKTDEGNEEKYNISLKVIKKFNYIPYIIGAIALGIIYILFKKKLFLVRKDKVQHIPINGEIMIVIYNEKGEESHPIFKKLSAYEGSISVFELLSSLPEYMETKKIKIKIYNDKVKLVNHSSCIVLQNHNSLHGNVENLISNNDLITIKLLESNKTISIKFFNL